MRETSLVTVQGKKQMCDAECIFLTKEQCEKLTSREFSEKVDSIAKECHIDWSIHDKNRISILHVTRTTTDTIDDAFHHELEIAATNFMSAIDKLEYDKKEPECPSHESNDDLEFVKRLLNDINLPLDNDSHVCGALIVDRTTHPFCPELTGWGKMGYNLLKEMCQLYIKAHNHG